MVKKAKAASAVGLLLAALVTGVFLSGYLVLLFLGLHDVPIGWDTYWRYASALDLAQVAPFATKIKLAGGLGFGLPVLLWLALTFALFKPRQQSIHGDARFATRADLKKAGLLDDSPEGIVIGRFGRDLLRLGGTQHVIMTAPTRTGKTTGVAIPVLLTYGHSIVAMDLKGELYQLTSGWRARQGQKIRVFAPYDEAGRTHRFNPFQMMSGDPRIRISEIQTIGAILYPDAPHKDPFWTNQSRTAFFAFASYLFEHWDHMVRQLVDQVAAPELTLDPNTDPRFPSFERIYKLSAGSGGKDTKALIQHILQGSEHAFTSEVTRTAFRSVVSLAEQTFSSVIGSMQEPLQQFLSPILAAATNASDFNVATLRKEPTTIYVVIPPDKLGEASKLLNIFFSTVVGQNLRVTPQEDKLIKNQLLLLLDEFTAMGRVDVLSKRISLTAGYWVRDLSIIQSLSQLDSTYGADEARTYITNHAASIVFTPREQRDAEEYSRQLGDTTVRRRNRTVGQGGTSYSHTEERRALMLPQELKALGTEEELIFLEGCPPIRCSKIRYFKDPLFKKRVLPKVEIEPAEQSQG
ncbi:type IV secretory system conjugative DNA transfer family protein [Variovorax sp. J22R24]|uniref:type IV secretory system conjugative DNA transfer family protein n=1 Tax=Variovorax gracilis TaxID=3053502 RepID=UPI002575F5D3|nr:type IV secretory system conjugative DNA transfer family protein [Variovorax sp. J22R24]MDM0105284.1 type IV secretory system conjugative DNA transfer family protein [Variovorax sp. J22R24]